MAETRRSLARTAVSFGIVLAALGAPPVSTAQDVPPAPPAPQAPPPPHAPDEPDTAADAPATVSWKDGHLTFESGHGSLVLSNRVQLRFTAEDPDDATTLAGTTEPGQMRSGFRVRRAKTELSGWAWRRNLTYEVQIGWAAADSGPTVGTFSGLEDALVNWDVNGDGRFNVRAGQFKVPFGRQEMTSSEKLQFADRDLLSFEFTRSRDVGVMLWGETDEARFQYWAGAFNGGGRNRATNDNAKYQLDARVTFQPWGDVGYSEGDFESTDRPLLAVSGQVEHNDAEGATNATDFKTTILGGDVVLKYRGASVFAEIFARDRDPEEVVPRSQFEAPSGGPSYASNGWHVQAGYFLKRRVLELAVRYAAWDPTDLVSGNDRSELGGALNWYLDGHRVKLQTDVRQIEDDARDTSDTELRAQFQIVF